MHRDNPASRTLLGLAAGAIYLPLLVFLCCNDYYGLPAFFGALRGPLWAGLVAATAIAVSVWGLLRSANVIRAGWLLGLIMYGQMFVSATRPEQEREGRLLIADYNGTSDVEVICNGVFLGRTPLVIDEADFNRRVPEWDVPPPQPHVDCPHEHEGKPAFHFSSSWYWSPHTPFRDLHHTAGDEMWMHREESFMSGMARQKYWWHFERDGMAGLKDLSSWGNGGGGSGIITYHTSLNGVTFPAIPRVVELLLQGLREADYRPSPEWTAFVLRHRQVLYRPLEVAAEDDPRMESVLDHLSRATFDLPAEPSEADARRILARIFDELAPREANISLSALTMEARAVARLAPLAPSFLVEEFRKQVPEVASSMGVAFSPGDGPESRDARGRRARREALFAALENVQPPEIFDALVYLYAKQNPSGTSGGGQLLEIIARYPRPEAHTLVRQRLIDQNNSQGVVDLLATLDIPELEGEFRGYIAQHVSAGQFSLQGDGGKFLRTRISRGQDLPQLIDWFAAGQFLNPGQKALLLAEIGNPQAGEWLDKLFENRTLPASIWDDAITWLARHPNPQAARFLVEAWTRLHAPGTHVSSTTLNQAILVNDGPAIREHLLRLAREDTRGWADLVYPPPQGPLPHLDWLVPVIAGFDDDFRRRSSCDLLVSIGTPAAETLLQNWREDENPDISEWVEKTMDKREQARRERETRHEQLSDLLAGRITPQSLVMPKPCVWRDGKYERQ